MRCVKNWWLWTIPHNICYGPIVRFVDADRSKERSFCYPQKLRFAIVMSAERAYSVLASQPDR